MDVQLLAGTRLLRQFEQLYKVFLALFLRIGTLSHLEINHVHCISRRFFALGTVPRLSIKLIIAKRIPTTGT
jgi:hypothetical protein